MTTLPPFDPDQVARELDTLDGTVPPGGTTADDLPDQYSMARRQYVSFSESEAARLNQVLDLMERCTDKRVSPNKFIKHAALQKAEQVLS